MALHGRQNTGGDPPTHKAPADKAKRCRRPASTFARGYGGQASRGFTVLLRWLADPAVRTARPTCRVVFLKPRSAIFIFAEQK